VPRCDQLYWRKYLVGWTFQYVFRDQLNNWEAGQCLQLPLPEIHGRFQENKLVILLNEIEGDHWTFRRNPEVQFPVKDLILDSAQSILILCPEVVLLYKDKGSRPMDNQDLQHVLPYLKRAQKGWLRSSIISTHGE